VRFDRFGEFADLVMIAEIEIEHLGIGPLGGESMPWVQL
jgi:hypothetical protein